MILFPEMADTPTADEYLAHRYERPDNLVLPMADEGFVSSWDIWLDQPASAPATVREILSDGSVEAWLESTPAGRAPVIYAASRESFVRTAQLLNPGAFKAGLPDSVNAFTINSRAEDIATHRVILLGRAGYSMLSGETLGFAPDEWLEKSKAVRLAHEVCHYFTLRAMGGMKNHALDEIAADCSGQLAAFGSFSARRQELFFGIDSGKPLPGGRFHFYVKNLSPESVERICVETTSAISSLEGFLRRNPEMALEKNRTSLVMSIASAGIKGIRDL